MKEILQDENWKVLESCSSSHTVYGFDFDGTLAPIVSNPTNARMSETTRALLSELNDIATVAIITGRSILDVQALLPFSPKYLIGNHGIEGILDEVALKKIKVLMETLKKTLIYKLKDESLENEIYVEDKIYSLSLHYRNATHIKETQNVLRTFFQECSSVRIIGGKMVLNVLPNTNDCKGNAFLKILKIENAKQGFYVGDDETDEDVFLCGDPRIIGVKVGKVKSSHAPFYINHQKDINALLEIFIKYIKSNSIA